MFLLVFMVTRLFQAAKGVGCPLAETEEIGVSPNRLLEGLPPLNAERTERIKKALARRRKAT
jgi:hypothetical protein